MRGIHTSHHKARSQLAVVSQADDTTAHSSFIGLTAGTAVRFLLERLDSKVHATTFVGTQQFEVCWPVVCYVYNYF